MSKIHLEANHYFNLRVSIDFEDEVIVLLEALDCFIDLSLDTVLILIALWIIHFRAIKMEAYRIKQNTIVSGTSITMVF